jgi:hypothetical protein
MAACPVNTTTVGKYSGGYGVGPLVTVEGAQAGSNPRREAIRRMWGSLILFIEQETPYYKQGVLKFTYKFI